MEAGGESSSESGLTIPFVEDEMCEVIDRETWNSLQCRAPNHARQTNVHNCHAQSNETKLSTPVYFSPAKYTRAPPVHFGPDEPGTVRHSKAPRLDISVRPDQSPVAKGNGFDVDTPPILLERRSHEDHWKGVDFVNDETLAHSSVSRALFRSPTSLPSGNNGPGCLVQSSANGGQVSRQPFSQQNAAEKTAVDAQWRKVFGSRETPIPWPEMTDHLKEIGELDFNQAFRLLESLKGEPLERKCSEEDIRGLKNVPAHSVPNYIAHLDALQNRRNLDEVGCENVENQSQRYDCCVRSNGSLIFKISEQKEPLNALQRCFGPDRVLRVFFTESNNAICHKIMNEGLVVGLRYFQYYAHKDTSQDNKRKAKPVDEEFWSPIHCYFICTNSIAQMDLKNPRFVIFETIAAARSYIMHIHTTPNIAKYASRLQLALSQTQPVDIDLSTVTVRLIEDTKCEDETGRETVCTDGTGHISVDLAKEIAASLAKVSKKNNQKLDRCEEMEEYPALIQIRLFHKGTANKGTLLTHNSLEPRTIVLRTSMQKVSSDPVLKGFPSFDSLEICGSSTKPREAKLSRDLIALLSLCRVPGSFFQGLVKDAIENVRAIFNDRAAAFEAIQDWETDNADLARRMMLVGISLQEPHLQKLLMELRKDLLQDFRKGRVLLPNSCYLYGTADPTGTLEPNEVAIALGHGLVSWPRVLVYKNPGKHPGDLHIFRTIANVELQTIVGSGKYVIFFSVKGPRSIPDEIANSDLDGDKYFVCWNSKLLADFQECQTRWIPGPKVADDCPLPIPKFLLPAELEKLLTEKFVTARYNSSSGVGIVSNWWLVHIDMHLAFLEETSSQEDGPHLQQAMEIIDYFYALVDCDKTGKKVTYPQRLNPKKVPHFQERGKIASKVGTPRRKSVSGWGVYLNFEENNNEYQSATILGKIYDMALKAEEMWRPSSYEDITLEPAFDRHKSKNFISLYKKWKTLLNNHNNEWTKLIEKETARTSHRRSGASGSNITRKYRKMLYGSDNLIKCTRPISTIVADASAIYAVTYNDGISKWRSGDRQPSFHFAWSVAGAILCRMFKEYYEKREEDAYDISNSVFKELFCKRQSRQHESK